MSKIKLSYSLLEYDIETAHLKGRFWRLGDQAIRHKQLLPNANRTQILTISYKWFAESKVTVIDCGDCGEKTKEMIAKFDKEIKKATVVIGKNNHRFDNQHINTARILSGGEAMPEWLSKSDDVESQLRRYFNFPSFSLDYVAQALGHGGKMKMEEEDWNSIEDFIEFNKAERWLKNSERDSFCYYFYNKPAYQVLRQGRVAFNKMKKYNKIDVLRTEAVLISILPHVQLKHNAATKSDYNAPIVCITCGSNDIRPAERVTRGTAKRENFHCNAHKGYAGSRPYRVNIYGNRRYTGPMGK